MQANLLIEGGPGCGKTTKLVQEIAENLDHSGTLVICHSDAGKDVINHYLYTNHHLEPNGEHLHVYTINHLATMLLQRFCNQKLADNEWVKKVVLPEVFVRLEQEFNISLALTDSNYHAFLRDLDLYRQSKSYERDCMEDFNFERDVIEHGFKIYEQLRYAWVWEKENQEAFAQTWAESGIGEYYGFFRAEEAVYDLLCDWQEMGVVEFPITPCTQIYIDEFHDISPLELDFLEQIARHCEAKVVAIGDRHQNIFAWRGSEPQFVFNEFQAVFDATVAPLLKTVFRFPQPLADFVNSLYGTSYVSAVSRSFSLEKQLTIPTVLKRNTGVVICKNEYERLVAAFDFLKHSLQLRQTVPYPFENLSVFGFIDAWYGAFQRLRQDSKMPAVFDETKDKIIEPSWLDYALKQTYAGHTIGTILTQLAHLNALSHYMAGCDEPAWLMMSQFLDTYYPLPIKQWGQIRKVFVHPSSTPSYRILTVEEAKGREFEQVVVYQASPQGFQTSSGPDNHFYVAITRAKQALSFLP